MRILVIDDDEDIREVLSVILGEEGYVVDQAADGADGLRRLQEGPRPSVILLDLMMPGLDGAAFMRILKGTPRMADIPVVVLSGHRSACRTAAELGATSCLVKPVDLDQLLRTLQGAATTSGASSREGQGHGL